MENKQKKKRKKNMQTNHSWQLSYSNKTVITCHPRTLQLGQSQQFIMRGQNKILKVKVKNFVQKGT